MTDSKIKNQTLLQEFSELKKKNSEIPTLSQKNNSLFTEIANLSIKISELEAKISAKESELKKQHSKFPPDIDTQIKILEQENAKLKESVTVQQTEIWKNEIAQNNNFKSIYETSLKEILEKFHSKGSECQVSLSSPLESEKTKLVMQLKKQEIVLQEAVNERNYIKAEVLPVLEHTLHLYEKNKIELDKDIECLEGRLKAPVVKKKDDVIYEEEELDTPVFSDPREHTEPFSPKQGLQYSFVSGNNVSARPSVSKVSLPSPRAKFMAAQIKSKKIGKN